MCGLVGQLHLQDPSPIDCNRLREASEALRHRGPDDCGLFDGGVVGLAARRLSIIDIARGHQPMSNARGTLHVVYNGEIYNHRTLRRELEALGKQFRTAADTEVLLHGYEAWGRDGLLARLRGMFAFAIWDTEQHSLLLARDRMGIKPLYFVEHGGRLSFASEIRSVLALSQIPRKANLAALALYMRIGVVTSPYTLFDGVFKLPPAHYLWVTDGRTSMREYWRLSYEPTNRDPASEVVEQFRERLQNSVDAHLMSDVPLGALLSEATSGKREYALSGALTGTTCRVSSRRLRFLTHLPMSDILQRTQPVSARRALGEVRRMTADWITRYNEIRPHESLGNIAPRQYLMAQTH
jgi:asparagine synthase (glutamine-hydrolysing)